MGVVDTAADLVLPDDHPGVNDTDYLRRRATIASVGDTWERGEAIPEVEYSAEEDAVWATVSRELAVRHQTYACAEYLAGAEALVLPTERVPQLHEVDARVHDLTGFHVFPVPGLVPTRRFYGDLADGVFNSTQYIRHHSVPFYTPEPDIVHEIIGHAQMLASPVFADLYRAAGCASRRAETDEALEFFSKVFWFTLEFGVVWESGDAGAELKTYGAGLLSSYGEITEFRAAEVRPWDLGAMGTTTYDITTYQPVLYAAPSFDEMVDRLGDFFETYDADTPDRLDLQEHSHR